MVNGSGKKLTDLADEFLLPSNPTHRQYEALRTFFVDRAPSAEAAERFGYTPGSFRVLCHEFRKNPQREFFLPQTKKAKLPPPRERLRQKIITLRKQNSSVYDIRDALDQSGEKLSPASISTILKEEGFARLPRRRDDERPATTRPNAADVADAGKLDLSERTFRTKVGGLFLFLPYLAKLEMTEGDAGARVVGHRARREIWAGGESTWVDLCRVEHPRLRGPVREATAKQLKQFQERSLEEFPLFAMYLDTVRSKSWSDGG